MTVLAAYLHLPSECALKHLLTETFHTPQTTQAVHTLFFATLHTLLELPEDKVASLSKETLHQMTASNQSAFNALYKRCTHALKQEITGKKQRLHTLLLILEAPSPHFFFLGLAKELECRAKELKTSEQALKNMRLLSKAYAHLQTPKGMLEHISALKHPYKSLLEKLKEISLD